MLESNIYSSAIIVAAVCINASVVSSKNLETSKPLQFKNHHPTKSHHQHMQTELETTGALPDMSLFQLESMWTNQDGKRLKLSGFISRPTVFALAYTSCTYACPIITSTMMGLERKFKDLDVTNVQFALISLDPKNDTPEQLKRYAEKRGLDLKKWTLLTSEDANVRELAVVLGINYKTLQSGDIAHSNVIFLMEKDGVVKDKVVGLGSNADRLLGHFKSASSTQQ